MESKADGVSCSGVPRDAPPVVVVDSSFEALRHNHDRCLALVSRAHVLLRGRGKAFHQSSAAGPASINTVVRGMATWETDELRYQVRPGANLVLDEGKTCSLAVSASTPVEIFCVLFRTGFLRELARDIRSSAVGALDNPEGIAENDQRVLSGLHPGSDLVGAIVERLRSSITAGTSAAGLEELLLAAGCALLTVDNEYRLRAARVTAARASTRQEILRRVGRGRDYIESHLLDHLALRDIARAAAMSTFHFHRSFVEVFGETPHAYTIRRRIALAKGLLRSSDLTISEVARAAGFGSPTSFNAVFRRRVCCNPTAFRRQGRRSPNAGPDRQVA